MAVNQPAANKYRGTVSGLYSGLFLGLATVILSVTAQGQTANKNLQYYLNSAFANSPLLKDADNQRAIASLDSLKVYRLNGLQAGASALGQYAPAFGAFGYDNAISNGGNYSATLNVTQPLFNRNFIRSQLQDVLVRRDSLGNGKKISLIDLKKNVINQYIQVFTDQSQFDFQKNVLSMLGAQETLLKPLVRAGTYRQSDYLTFLVTRQAQEVTVAQNRISLLSDLNALNLLCGIVDTARYILDDPGIALAPERSLLENPLFLKFKIDSLRIQSQRQSLDANYRPKLNWFADAGFESSQFAFYKNYGASFGLNFSIPIYDGHLRQIGYKSLKITENTRKSYKRAFQRQYNQQILGLRQQLQAIQELEKTIRSQLHYSEMLMEVNRKLLNAGDQKLSDYLLALAAYRNTQFSLSQQVLSRLVIINQLNYWLSDY